MSNTTQTVPFKIEMGNDSSVTAHGYGDVKPITLVGNEEMFCNRRRLLYVLELKYNLLSVSVTDWLSFDTEFYDGKCRNKKGASIIAEGIPSNGFYIARLS